MKKEINRELVISDIKAIMEFNNLFSVHEPDIDKAACGIFDYINKKIGPPMTNDEILERVEIDYTEYINVHNEWVRKEEVSFWGEYINRPESKRRILRVKGE